METVHDVLAWLETNETHDKALNLIMVLSLVLPLTLTYVVQAPYGRYATKSWGPTVSARVGWFVMESPSFYMYLFFFLRSPHTKWEFMPIASSVLFCAHYFHRSIIYPMKLNPAKTSHMPIITSSLAFMWCNLNGYVQAYYNANPANFEGVSMTTFLIGATVFITGMAINIHSDYYLLTLRKPGETGYKIPRAGMFNYVSGANFFGEILEWTGYAIALNSPSGWAFAVFTAANIGPRALTHHKDYLKKFGKSYPKSRKALIPFVL